MGEAPVLAFQTPGSIGVADRRTQNGNAVSAVGLACECDIVFVRFNRNDARLRIGLGEEFGRNPAMRPAIDDERLEILRDDRLVSCVEFGRTLLARNLARS